jgi:hypothetical protein
MDNQEIQGNPGIVTSRRCKRCGVIGHNPHPNGLCKTCTKWTGKKGKKK